MTEKAENKNETEDDIVDEIVEEEATETPAEEGEGGDGLKKPTEALSNLLLVVYLC